MPQNPYAPYAPKNPYAVYGVPRTPPPQTPDQAVGQALQNTHTQAETARIPLQNENTRVSTQQTLTQINNTKFDNVNNLRKQFEAEQSVQDYKTVLPLMDSALKIQNNKAGDLNLVYAFGKTMDPNSVVREGEQVMATNVGGVAEKVKGYIAQIAGQGGLTPIQRTQLIEEIRSRARSLNGTYNQRRGFYEDFAKRNGINPNDVVGPHPGDPFAQDEQGYIREHGGTPKAAGVPIPAEPGVTEQGFGLRPPPGTPPHADEARQAVYEAIRSGDIKSAGQMQTWMSGWNKAHGTNFKIEPNDAAIRAARSGKPFNVSTPQYTPDITDVRGGNNTPTQDAFNAGVRGIVDTPTLGAADKIVAGADTLFKGGTMNENLARQYAISDYDQQNHPIARLAGQAGGGLLLPMGEMSSIPQIAAKGAAVGGAYGAGSSRSLGDVPQNALLGAVGGAAVGGTLAGAGKLAGAGMKIAGRRAFGNITPEQRSILDAGAQEGVPVNMADVFPQARNTVGTLESMPGASGPIQKGLEAGRDAMGSRVADLGRGGTPRENMGDSIQAAGTKFVKGANRQASRLYDRARSLAADTPISPTNSATVSQALMQAEDAVPGGTKAGAVIKRYADAFAGGQPITIDGARAMRSELLNALRTDGGLSKGKATHITGQIMGAVNQDIESGLAAAGKTEAVQAYRFADKFYAQTRAEIEQNIEKFIGTERAPKSAEQTIAAMNAAAGPKGNAKALTGMLARMSKDERTDYAATLAEGLGRKSPDEPFSPAAFITQVRKLSPAARRIVFGSDGEKSIQNLLTLANAKQATVGGLNNSRSGMVANYRSVLSTVLFGLPGGGAALGLAQAANVGSGATGMATGAAVGLTGLGMARAVAKALMNEEFTRAIARAPATTNPKAIDAHFGLLRRIAARDPNVRSVVEALEKKLLSHANDNALKAAAASDSNTQERQ